MPASLSNQIRLGFSLGWRIWTPNEVGFYAKTLAHSYFIFTILKAKFFTKKLWVVNYSIFVAAAKYLVFVEFIEFGIKTKEERTYWKKIMYISLLIRHAKYKSKLKYTPNFEKMKTLGRFFRKLNEKKRNSGVKPKIWEYFKKTLGPAALKRTEYSEDYKKSMDVVTEHLNTKKYLNLKFYKLDMWKPEKYETVNENKKSHRRKVKQAFKHEYKAVRIKSRKAVKWSNLTLPKKEKKLTGKQLMQKKERKKVKRAIYLKLTANSITRRKNIRVLANFDTISAVLGRKLKKKEKKSLIVKRPLQRNPAYRITRLHNQEAVNYNAVTGPMHILQDNLRLKDKAELMHAFRSFTQKRFECSFSVTGGPRKRLFRNIKRSFQGKFIVHYASLVWFWEKISRLITYIVKKLTKSYFQVSK